MTDERDVGALLAALGGPDFARLIDGFDRYGEGVCEVLLSIMAGDVSPEPFGDPRAVHPKAVWDDMIQVLCLAAQRWPDRFVARVAADQQLTHSLAVLWALGHAETAAAGEVLLDATRVRGPGGGHVRWNALSGLVRQAHPALPDALVPLVRDRDSLTRFTAVEAAIGYGDSRLVPDLHRIALAERTAPGTRECAWDAIEAIRIREGLTDAPESPHPDRLVAIRRPVADSSTVLYSQTAPGHTRVHRGQHLATLAARDRQFTIVAPVDGLLVANLLTTGRPAPAILMWIREI